MNYEQEINKLKTQVKNLQESFLQAQRNQTPITAKVDDSANKIVDLTPYKDTKTAYIGDIDVAFENVPYGNISVFGVDDFYITKIANRTYVNFKEPLEEVTEVTITVQ